MPLATDFGHTIKGLLKARGHTYAWLADKLGLSEPSVKRLLSRGGISLERLDAICDALEVEGNHLLDLVRRRDDQLSEFTLEQERALADDATMLVVLYMLLNGWTKERIMRDCNLSEAEVIAKLSSLDRLKLVTLLPTNRIRLRITKDHTWRPNGPLRNRYREQALRDFVSSTFAGDGEHIRFEFGVLGQSALLQLKRRVNRLAHEFNELADLDALTPAAPAKRATTLVVAFRPWDFTRIVQIRKSHLSSQKPTRRDGTHD